MQILFARPCKFLLKICCKFLCSKFCRTLQDFAGICCKFLKNFAAKSCKVLQSLANACKFSNLSLQSRAKSCKVLQSRANKFQCKFFSKLLQMLAKFSHSKSRICCKVLQTKNFASAAKYCKYVQTHICTTLHHMQSSKNHEKGKFARLCSSCKVCSNFHLKFWKNGFKT